jgi:hypothetical protein
LLSAETLRTSQTAKVTIVLIASGIGGFHAGMVTFPDWQVAVETAQVVAGVVQYPVDNPFYLYHLKLWTVLHQICALLLRAGMSEIALSKLVSGVLGMVSFQAIALIVYGLSRDALLAIGSAFLIAFTRTAEYGVNYPIYLLGTPHTYGVIGLSLIVLIAGLAGAGWHRTAGFLLGIAPSVHPSLGAWFVMTMGAAAVWHWWRERFEIRAPLKFFLLGCAVTAISLFVQLAQTRGIPAIDPQLADKYLKSFVSFWDAHRQTVSLSADGTKLSLGVLLLAIAWLKLSRGLAGSGQLLLRVVIVTTTASLVLGLLSFIPPASLPSMLLVLMPGRLVNFGAFVAVAVLIGLLGHASKNRLGFWSRLFALYLSVGLLIGNRSMLWDWIERSDGNVVQHALRNVLTGAETRPLQILLTVTVLLIVVTAIVARSATTQQPAGEELPQPATVARPTRLLMNATYGLIVTVLAGVIVLLWQWPAQPGASIFVDRTNNLALGQVAKDSGLLLTGGDIQLIQIRTRRPILINGGGLDGLPYALESGPALERILRDVYAIDLFNPPDEARGRGAIPNQYNQAAWERFSRDQWQMIRRTYAVTQVMTPPGWSLALPVVLNDAGFVLYELPD